MENRRLPLRNGCESGVFLRGRGGNCRREGGTAGAVFEPMAGEKVGAVAMGHTAAESPRVMSAVSREVRGRQAWIFMGRGSAEDAKFPRVKERQLDNAGNVAAVVEAGRRRVFPDRLPEQEWFGCEAG